MILLGFLFDTLRIALDAGGDRERLRPRLRRHRQLLLATGILGATVMPHVIYLHSALTQRRIARDDDDERRRLLRFQRVDVTIAMGVAGVINMAMLIVAASLFHGPGTPTSTRSRTRTRASTTLVGPGAALAFALALLASGLASSSVGTYAGQVVMQGFIDRTIPLVAAPRWSRWRRRSSCSAIGVDPTRALVHQPGRAVVRHPVRARAAGAAHAPARRSWARSSTGRSRRRSRRVVAALIIALNVFLLVQTFA